MMELTEQFYGDLGRRIMPYFEVNDDLHGLSHSQRVWNNSRRIMNGKANVDIVRMQSFLHDIANPIEMRGECGCHAVWPHARRSDAPGRGYPWTFSRKVKDPARNQSAAHSTSSSPFRL